MSYILDALRKADAQRERDAARGLHAQALGTTGETAAPRWRLPLVLGGAAAIVLAALAWAMLRGPAAPVQDPPRPVVQPASAQAGATGGPAQPLPAEATASARPAPGSVAAATPLPAQPAATIQPPPPPPVVEPAPRPVPPAPPPAVRPAAPAQPPRAEAAATVAPSAATPRAAAASGPAGAAAERILSAAEVPDLPRLAISGGVYSDNAAQRMLIVSGQVVNEGSEIAPGVVLEQIRPKSAVLRYRGQRIGVPF